MSAVPSAAGAPKGVVDLRSQYTQNSNTKNTFTQWSTAIRDATDPHPPKGPSAVIFEGVRTQLTTEMGYGETIESWFFNNNAVLSDNFGASSGLLTSATGEVNASTTTTVTSKWLEFAGDIVSAIAGNIPGGGDFSMAITIFNDTYQATTPSGGDVQQEVSQISNDLTTANSTYITVSAAQQTAYLSDYSKMKQIGTDASTGGYDWANASLDAISDAKNGGRHGMTVNFLRELLPAKWNVYWCTGADWQTGAPLCSSYYTQDKYNCTYGVEPGTGYFPYENAYIYATSSTDVNWSLLDRLTGPVTAGTTTDNLDAIWYMMLLGGDLG